jgi:hypothetical protein
MKKRNLQRIFAAFMATAMVVGGTACSKSDDKKADPTPTPASNTDDGKKDPEPTKEEEKKDPEPTKEAEASTPTPTEEVQPTPDEPTVDLGGITIYIRDWWSSGNVETGPGEPNANPSTYEEDRDNYREEVMTKYNFKMYNVGGDDWGQTSQNFVDYVNSNGDANYYIWTLHSDETVANAMSAGLMYDLATLDCLNFNDDLYQRNKLHEKFAKGNSIYAFFPGFSEPRTGVYFNKKVLADANIDFNEIYEAQKNDTWTWDKFEELMNKCQRDTNNDGVDDVYGLCLNESVMTDAAVFSNGGSYVAMGADGKYINNLTSPETEEALRWCAEMYTKYDDNDPDYIKNPGENATGSEWEYYKEQWLAGSTAFLVDQEYCAAPGNLFEKTDFEMGFVMFPKGRSAKAQMVTNWDNNAYVIPGCYDADKAWKIAFAWNVWQSPAPGYEDYNGYIETAKNGNFDEKALEETLPLMADPAHGAVSYHDLIPGLATGPDLTWSIGVNADVSAAIDGAKTKWDTAIAKANGEAVEEAPAAE